MQHGHLLAWTCQPAKSIWWPCSGLLAHMHTCIYMYISTPTYDDTHGQISKQACKRQERGFAQLHQPPQARNPSKRCVPPIVCLQNCPRLQKGIPFPLVIGVATRPRLGPPAPPLWAPARPSGAARRWENLPEQPAHPPKSAALGYTWLHPKAMLIHAGAKSSFWYMEPSRQGSQSQPSCFSNGNNLTRTSQRLGHCLGEPRERNVGNPLHSIGTWLVCPPKGSRLKLACRPSLITGTASCKEMTKAQPLSAPPVAALFLARLRAIPTPVLPGRWKLQAVAACRGLVPPSDLFASALHSYSH